MNVREAAERLEIDVSTLYRLCRDRRIRHRRVGTGGGRIVFTPEDLADYLASCVVEVRPREEAPAESSTVRLKYIRAQGARRA